MTKDAVLKRAVSVQQDKSSVPPQIYVSLHLFTHSENTAGTRKLKTILWRKPNRDRYTDGPTGRHTTPSLRHKPSKVIKHKWEG